MTNLDLKIGKKIDPNITFYAGDPFKEVMRIDKNGVKVNPEYTVDEATQQVLNALSSHIQYQIKTAVDAERESCAKLCDKEANDKHESDHWTGCAYFLANNIRARNTQPYPEKDN